MLRIGRLFDRATLALVLAFAGCTAAAGVAEAEGASPPPIYSLVIARAQIRSPSPYPLDCGGAVCLDSAYGASFDHLRTIAGPDIDEPLSALVVSHMRATDVPVLLLVQTMPDSSKEVLFWARDGSSRANFRCIGGAAFTKLDWHPAGPDIVLENDAVCANVSEIVALPSSLPVMQVQVITPREFRRMRPHAR